MASHPMHAAVRTKRSLTVTDVTFADHVLLEEEATRQRITKAELVMRQLRPLLERLRNRKARKL